MLINVGRPGKRRVVVVVAVSSGGNGDGGSYSLSE